MEWLTSLLGFKDVFSKAIDQLPNSPAKTEALAKLKELDVEILKVQSESLKNARETALNVETSTSASWLSKNIRNILALLIIGSLILCILLQSFSSFKISEMLLGGLIGASGSVLTYYFDGTFGTKK